MSVPKTPREIFESCVNQDLTAKQTELLLLAEEATLNQAISKNRAWLAKRGDSEIIIGKDEIYESLRRSESTLEELHSLLLIIRANNQETNKLEEVSKIDESISSSILAGIHWHAHTSDLARIFKALKDGGLIQITGREFAKHFSDRKGNPMPQDFAENLTAKQDPYSKNQAVQNVIKIAESIIIEA